MMKNATKISKILGLTLLSLSLIYCGGSAEDGTIGTSIEIQGEQIDLLIPVLSASGNSNEDIIVDVTIADSDYLSHIEMERHVSSNPFAFIADVFSLVHVDTGLSNGTYRYRARAVYSVNGATYFSDYSDEVSRTVGPVSQLPSDASQGTT